MLTERLLKHARGRRIEDIDRPAVAQIAAGVEQGWLPDAGLS